METDKQDPQQFPKELIRKNEVEAMNDLLSKNEVKSY